MDAIGRALSEFSSDLPLAKSLALAKTYSENGFYRNSLTSKLINRFIGAVQYVENTKFPALGVVRLTPEVREEVEVLKHFTFVKMIQSNRLKLVSCRAEFIIEALMTTLRADGGWELLPEDFQVMFKQASEGDVSEGAGSNTNCMRVLCDFVAGMTDKYAVEFYCRLRSENYQTIFRGV